MNSEIVNILASRKGRPQRVRKKECPERKVNRNKNIMVKDFSQEAIKLDVHLRERTLLKREAG